MADGGNLDLIGFSRSTADGPGVAFAAAPSEEQDRRRTVARVLAFTWLGLMVLGLLGILVVVVV